MGDWIQAKDETVREDHDAVIRRLTAEIERLQALLRECSDDLAAEIEHRYCLTLDYPSQKAKYDRDMTPVLNARRALEQLAEDERIKAQRPQVLPGDDQFG